MKSKVTERVKRLTRDPRFILGACSIVTWWLVLPNGSANYGYPDKTPWGQTSILFIAALLLWINIPVIRLISVTLSILILYLACADIINRWKLAVRLEPEMWRELLFWSAWRDVPVCALAAYIAIYSRSDLKRKIIRRRATLP
jgi:hypothetical protein